MSGLKFVLIAFFVWRIALFLPLFASEQLLSYRPGYDYTNIWKFTKAYEPVSHFLIYPWANFDGVHYLSIAGSGYNNENLGFFPLFPAVIGLTSSLFGGGETFGAIQFFAGFLLSNLAFLAALFVLYKLIELDYSLKIAKFTILFLLVFPTSFFFVSIYSESLFLLLTLLSFYFARREKWFLAGIFAMLTTLTRLVGITILPALLFEFFKPFFQPPFLQPRRFHAPNLRGWTRAILAGLPILLIPIGFLGFALYNRMLTNDAFYFIKAHGTLANSRSVETVILIPQTVFRYGKILLSFSYMHFEWWIALLELATFVFVAALLFVAWKKKVRLSYILFALIAFLIPVSSGTFTGLPRYVLVLFPIFIALALVKNRLIQVIYMVISSILLFILLLFISKGYFVS